MKTTIIIIILILTFSSVYSQGSLELIATITGEKIGDSFGTMLSAGDVNGDGYNDFMITGNKFSKLFYGGFPMDTIADFIFPWGGEIIKDVHKDGFDDIFIHCYVSPYKKNLIMYSGGSNIDTIPDFEFSGTISTETLGSILTSVGDVNGDGFNDFIVGSRYNWIDGRGRVYLFFGGKTIKTEPSITFMSNRLEDFFGMGGCGCDINNDGFFDILIGAPAGMSDRDTGKVYIYFGGNQIDNKADSILYRNDCTGYTMFGYNISNAGDINSDGMEEVSVTSGVGVYLYLKNNSIMFSDYSIGTGGDINNDGIDDFVIGNANYVNTSGITIGQARGYFGGAELDTLYDFSMEGENKGGRFSMTLIIAGDLNGDGYDEVIIGAPGYPDYQNPLGKVYIYSYVKWNNVEGEIDFNDPEGFRLNQNYPNPFNSETAISYCLEHACSVDLGIYNCTGRKIKTMVSETQESGNYHVTWKGKDENDRCVSSGIYLVIMRIKKLGMINIEKYKTQKVLLIK